MRRQRPALLDRLDAHRPIVESHDEDAASPMTASSMMLADQADGGGSDRPAQRTDVFEGRPDSDGAPPGLADRRVYDDPTFPRVFNRRGVAPTRPSSGGLPGWIPRSADQHPAGDSSIEPTDTIGAAADGNDHTPGLDDVADESPIEEPVPTPVADDEFGQTVGFNPDFDINQFR